MILEKWAGGGEVGGEQGLQGTFKEPSERPRVSASERREHPAQGVPPLSPQLSPSPPPLSHRDPMLYLSYLWSQKESCSKGIRASSCIQHLSALLYLGPISHVSTQLALWND